MNRLLNIIEDLDKKPVSAYSRLYGTYYDENISYYIGNVTGTKIKYCTIDISIPVERLLGDLPYSPFIEIPLCYYSLCNFAVAAHMINAETAQSETKTAKGYFVPPNFTEVVSRRSICTVNHGHIIFSISVRLPYTADTTSKSKTGHISSHALKLLLYKNMPMLVRRFAADFDLCALKNAIELYNDQQFIRQYLADHGYVSFIGNGSVLPKRLRGERFRQRIIPFSSPKGMEISIQLPSGKKVTGMGIQRGVTIIIGDAYHGKSTLISAIAGGVLNRCASCGRGYVITDESALSIRAEEGRNVQNTDISFYVTDPSDMMFDPKQFTSVRASGSTSQAAAVYEGMEAKCRLMLFDEDKSANNFMYKDAAMKRIIKNASTRPFIDSIRKLYEQTGTSSILVVGSSAEYFAVADRVILLDRYLAYEYKDYEKKNIADDFQFMMKHERRLGLSRLRNALQEKGMAVTREGFLVIGGETVPVKECIPDCTQEQMAFIGAFMHRLANDTNDGKSIGKALRGMYSVFSCNITSLSITTHQGFSNIEFVREADMRCIINRMRLIDLK